MNKALEIYKDKHDQTGELYAKRYEANLDLRSGQEGRALTNANAALKQSRAMKADEITLSLLDILSDAHQRLGHLDQALDYSRQYRSLSDSVFSAEKSRTVAELQYAYESEKKDNEIQQLRAEEEQQKLVIIIVSIGAVAALFLMVVIALSKRVQLLKHREREMQLKAAHEKAEHEKYEAEVERRIEEEKNKKLQVELESSQRELTTSTLYIHQKNRLLEEVQEELEKLADRASNAGQKDHFSQISKNLQTHMKFENDWDNIILHFEKVHPDFFNKLRSLCPDLTANELKQAAYIRINLNSKEVANLLNIDQASVKQSRYRMKKKLQLPQDEDLTGFIMSL